MLDSIIFSANAVFPLVILIFFGMLLKTRKKLFADPKAFFGQLERFVFNVALPVSIFNEVAQSRVVFNPWLVIYCASAIIILCAALWIATPFIIKDIRARGAFINGICRPNFVLLGVPLVISLTGGAGSAALVLPFMVPLFNIMGAVILASHAEEAQDRNIKKILLEVAKNPLIHAVFIGLAFMLAGIRLPGILQSSAGYIGRTATPLALISLGAGADLRLLRANIRLSLSAALFKTVVCPVIFVLPAFLFDFGRDELAVIYVLAAAPSAVASYIMAKNMRSDADLAGQILALTTIICPATIFAGSVLLRAAGVL